MTYSTIRSPGSTLAYILRRLQMHTNELRVHTSMYCLYIEQSKRTFQSVQDNCNQLLRAFEFEKYTSYDPVDEPIVLEWGYPRLYGADKLLCSCLAALAIATSDMFGDVGRFMAMEYFIDLVFSHNLNVRHVGQEPPGVFHVDDPLFSVFTQRTFLHHLIFTSRQIPEDSDSVSRSTAGVQTTGRLRVYQLTSDRFWVGGLGL